MLRSCFVMFSQWRDGEIGQMCSEFDEILSDEGDEDTEMLASTVLIDWLLVLLRLVVFKLLKKFFHYNKCRKIWLAEEEWGCSSNGRALA